MATLTQCIKSNLVFKPIDPECGGIFLMLISGVVLDEALVGIVIVPGTLLIGEIIFLQVGDEYELCDILDS